VCISVDYKRLCKSLGARNAPPPPYTHTHTHTNTHISLSNTQTPLFRCLCLYLSLTFSLSLSLSHSSVLLSLSLSLSLSLTHTHTHTHTHRLLSCLIIPRLEESKHIVLACTFFTAKNNNTLQRHVTLHVGEFTSACFHGDH